ncbi:hypothetical protein [Clostridium tyrobutyricum]|uniref:hypothetical protein n=1 Tax=Clostridium tyrobutyricum TaxID=1519 RepID=UPI001FA7BF50|nr:hypothetical protein [Clostridium tyrobutyricum]
MESIRNHILHDRGYFVTDGTHVLYYLCIDFDGEPAHSTLNGTWKSDLPYAVVHRMAISNAYKEQGLASIIFHLVDELCKEKKFIVFMWIPTRQMQSCSMFSRKMGLNIAELCGLTIASNMHMKNSLKQCGK